MRIIDATYKSPIGLVALLLFVTNCNSSEFGANSIDNADGKKKTEVTENTGETLGQVEGEDDRENTEADQSVEVSGAFLTCQTDEALPKANDKEIGFGCTVFETDGRKKDLTTGKFEFVLETISGEKKEAKFDKNHENYHVISSVDLVALNTFNVGYYPDDNNEPVLKAKIDNWYVKNQVDLLSNAQEKETIFGKDLNFHIGDGNFTDNSNSDCPKQLEGKDVQGKKIVIKVEVKSEYAYISANLDEICGVDRSKNYIIYSSNNGSWNPQKSIPTKATSLDYGSVKVRKGTYSFEIRSGKSNDDLDDFVVGKITFKAKGEVEFSDPGVEN